MTVAPYEVIKPEHWIFAGTWLARGDLFGTTQLGGDIDQGEVFEVQAGSGTVTPLASFNGANGSYPQAGLILDNSGNLFGTTNSGETWPGVVY